MASIYPWCETPEEAWKEVQRCCFCGDMVSRDHSDDVYDPCCDSCAAESQTNPFWRELLEYRDWVYYGGNPMLKLPGFTDFWHEVNMGGFTVIPVD